MQERKRVVATGVRKLTVFALGALSAVALHAADLVWPSDFATSVSAREAFVRPAGAAVAGAGLDLIGGGRLVSAAVGTEPNPFDSWRFFASETPGIPFNTHSVGFLLLFR